jgi:hypothetical protein
MEPLVEAFVVERLSLGAFDFKISFELNNKN